MKIYAFLLLVVLVSATEDIKAGMGWLTDGGTVGGEIANLQAAAQSNWTDLDLDKQLSNMSFPEVFMYMASRPGDGELVTRIFQKRQFTVKECQYALPGLVRYGKKDLGSSFDRVVDQLWTNCLRAIGGIGKLDLDSPLFQNNSLIFYMPAEYYKQLSDSQFQKLLSLAYLGQHKLLTAFLLSLQDREGQQTGMETGQESGNETGQPTGQESGMEVIIPTEGYKQICKRLFGYKRRITITEDFFQKSLAFLSCAPVDVCASVPLDLIQKYAGFFKIYPITCFKMEQPLPIDIERLFPGAQACAREIAEKVVGKEPVVITEMVERYGNIITCLSEDTMISQVKIMDCRELRQHMTGLPHKVAADIVKRCLQLPTDYSSIDCPTVLQNFSDVLPYLPRDFSLQLPQETLCNPMCTQVFQKGLDDGMTKKLVSKCFKVSKVPLTQEAIRSMGSLLTELPLEKLEQISSADLVANFDSIKEGLESEDDMSQGKQKAVSQGRRKAVREIVKKVATASGDLSQISDCKTCIQSLSVRDLKKTITSNDTAEVLTKLGLNNHTVQFTDSQAKFLAKKVIAANITTLSVADYRGMKSIVKGLLSRDVEKIAEDNKNRSDGLAIAVVFCEQTNWPTKTLRSIYEMIVDGLEFRNSSDPMKALTAVDVAGFGCECLMNFVEDQLASMDPLVCTDVCKKVGQCDNFDRLNRVHRKNFLYGCMKCQNLRPESFTTDNIENLGANLLAQLTPEQVALVPSTAFPAFYDMLPRMCLSPDLAEAMTNKLAGFAAGLTTNDIYKLSSAMYLLSAEAQSSLDKGVLRTMAADLLGQLLPSDPDALSARKDCEYWLDDAERAQLKKARFRFLVTLKNALMASTARRKRSESSFWTCSNIQQYGELFLTATVEEIGAMSGDDFKACIDEIGTMNWNTEQKTALKAKMLAAYNATSACDVVDIGSIGTLVTTLTVTEIRCLPLNDSTLVSALGSLGGWQADELTALASGVLAAQGVTNLSQSNAVFLATLGSIICGFEPQVLTTIPPALFPESGPQYSLYSDCTTAHLAALKGVLSDPAAYGPPASWTAATMSELLYVIGGVTGEEMKSLSLDAIEGISPVAIPAIPGDVLKELSVEQFSAFSDSQAVAVTAAQRQALSADQVSKLEDLSTLGQEDIAAIGVDDISVGAQVAVSLITTLLMLMTSAMILL